MSGWLRHNEAMAYDEELAMRVRSMTGPGVTEKRMFGGLAFLAGGNMAVTVSAKGGLLARVDPAELAGLLDDGVTPAVMGGREMRGWLRVSEETVATDDDLRTWVARCVRFANTLPRK